MTEPGVDPQSTGSHTSLSLLARVRLRDRAAWERLVQLYGPLVYGWCLRAGLQPADAADVGQDVFAAVARAIDGFRHDRKGDTFRGWLYVITRNKLRDRAASPGATGAGGSDALRRLADLPADGSADDSATASGDDEGKVLCRRALEMIRNEFEARTFQAFWRAFVEGQAPADVAADLGVSVNAVYLAKSRILRRLREEFFALVEFDATGAPS